MTEPTQADLDHVARVNGFEDWRFVVRTMHREDQAAMRHHARERTELLAQIEPLYTAEQVAAAVKAREAEIVAWLHRADPYDFDFENGGMYFKGIARSIADAIEKGQA